VFAVYALAREALGSREGALLAAAIAAISPLFLLHSALYLSYLFTTLLATAALACGFRSARLGSRAWAGATGVLLGAMVLSRPFDAVLTGLTVLLVAVLAGRRAGLGGIRWLAVVLGAAMPFVVLALVWNLRTTGSLFEFPVTAGDPRNIFGFGDRALQVGTSPLHYDLRAAWRALGDNLRGGVGWVFGGWVTIALATWSVARRHRRRERLVLVVYLALFPLGYFFWWATALAAPGATNGLGPHYYVPAFIPLVVLAADPLADLARRGGLVPAALVGVVMVGATVVNVPDKLDGNRYVTDRFKDIERALPDDLADALVFVASDRVASYTTLAHPFLVNPPRLDGPVLYPVDRHGENGRLIRAHPERRAYLLHRELRRGDELLHPRWVLTPLRVQSGPSVAIGLRFIPPASGAYRRVAKSDDGQRIAVPVMGNRGETVDFEVVLSGQKSAATNAGATNDGVLALAPGSHDVMVEVEREDRGERWQRLYRVAVDEDRTVIVVRPGIGQHVVDFGGRIRTFQEDVDAVIAEVH
jgi:hypothetical protein